MTVKGPTCGRAGVDQETDKAKKELFIALRSHFQATKQGGLFAACLHRGWPASEHSERRVSKANKRPLHEHFHPLKPMHTPLSSRGGEAYTSYSASGCTQGDASCGRWPPISRCAPRWPTLLIAP